MTPPAALSDIVRTTKIVPKLSATKTTTSSKTVDDGGKKHQQQKTKSKTNIKTISLTSSCYSNNNNISSLSLVDINAMHMEIGSGPCLYALYNERTLQEQINSLSMEEKMCYDNLRLKWEETDYHKFPNTYWYLRFARCSPGVEKYNEEAAWNVMLNFNHHYCSLRAKSIEQQLLTKAIFPVLGLQTIDGHDVLYMRPSRYFLSSATSSEINDDENNDNNDNNKTVVNGKNNNKKNQNHHNKERIMDNLVYVINTMMEKEKACTDGIAALIYMNDWKQQGGDSISNFRNFYKVLQGSVPVRIRLCLIINPPKWFFQVWQVLKPMLTKDFRSKVIMIQENELSKYLMEGYENYLPDDTDTGYASTDNSVQDFITYRKYIESIRDNADNSINRFDGDLDHSLSSSNSTISTDLSNSSSSDSCNVFDVDLFDKESIHNVCFPLSM